MNLPTNCVSSKSEHLGVLHDLSEAHTNFQVSMDITASQRLGPSSEIDNFFCLLVICQQEENSNASREISTRAGRTPCRAFGYADFGASSVFWKAFQTHLEPDFGATHTSRSSVGVPAPPNPFVCGQASTQRHVLGRTVRRKQTAARGNCDFLPTFAAPKGNPGFWTTKTSFCKFLGQRMRCALYFQTHSYLPFLNSMRAVLVSAWRRRHGGAARNRP